MAKIYHDKLLVSIDVGTTKICVMVGQQTEKNKIEILGIGQHPSDGLKKGVVVDVSKTIDSIKKAVALAEQESGIKIGAASVGISGAHIESANSHGLIPIKHGKITPEDVAAVLNAAKTIPIDQGMQVLHVLPQYFVIDSRDKIHNPIGMHGVRLEVQAHIIMGAISSVQNLVSCVQAAGIRVTDIVLEQIASAAAVLNADERELGIAVLDIGGGTSDLALYQHGNIRHTMVLPIAGNHFTNDLAVGLRTTISQAEQLKRTYGLAYPQLLLSDQVVLYQSLNGQEQQAVRQSYIAHILHARAQELLGLVEQEIIQHKLEPMMSAGLVLTGGGSLLTGMQELAAQIFEVPIRIGMPMAQPGMPDLITNPIYATGYGLLLYMLDKKESSLFYTESESMTKRIMLRMRSWVSDFF